ncbi:uncharacterized protein CcaverHIS019_0511270 [Cutaneotrichosporon cavernicola]|uniref:Mitochondrial carrier n=1 Tax=Cutaneotrichosporon cavernicola TaxID=279322 RepID=A0AA48L7N0_9TREE|nr:uncharacterized protein CcaverHIS019_0511270 [Cutaneotrichosporon cavernicola]BEI93499.1 hypothetical protein CcaverHIS019_0511270 [Cutaneotrichosporon cavernicola]
MDFDPGYLAIFVASRLTSTAFGMPVAGALTRMQSNWVPKGKGEKGENVDVANDCTDLGVIGTIRRTWTIEGAGGIFKGTYLSTIASLAGSFGSAMVDLASPFPREPDSDAITNVIRGLGLSSPAILGARITAAVATNIAFIPFKVLISRSVVTPLRLSMSPSSIRGITSERERNGPWRLWAIPGMIANITLQTLTPFLVTAVTLPLLYAAAAAATPQAENETVTAGCALAYIAANTIPTLWMAPLKVLEEKLAVAPDADMAEIKATDAEFERFSAEDVVVARPPPRYTGLMDAFNTVRKEEGIGALYRGWIWTAFYLSVSALNQAVVAVNAAKWL